MRQKCLGSKYRWFESGVNYSIWERESVGNSSLSWTLGLLFNLSHALNRVLGSVPRHLTSPMLPHRVHKLTVKVYRLWMQFRMNRYYRPVIDLCFALYYNMVNANERCKQLASVIPWLVTMWRLHHSIGYIYFACLLYYEQVV